ncbi:hypothetical protein D3C71_1559750 [compost metagenome]
MSQGVLLLWRQSVRCLGLGDIADELPVGFVVGLLQCQSLVVDESARSGKAAHAALLRPVGHQLEFEGLQALHTGILSSSYE